jgi:hypothetical protein
MTWTVSISTNCGLSLIICRSSHSQPFTRKALFFRQMIEILERILRHSSAFPAYSFCSFVLRCSDRPDSWLATFCAVFPATGSRWIWAHVEYQARGGSSRSAANRWRGDRRSLTSSPSPAWLIVLLSPASAKV